MKNGETGKVEFNSTDVALALNYALEHKNSVYVKSGYYQLYSDVFCHNKKGAIITGESATLFCNNHLIKIVGDSCEDSQYDQISGFTIYNGTLRLENSFRTIVNDINFINCPVGIELANTFDWSESNKIDDCHFVQCTQGIVFRAPIAPGTGSYQCISVSRCYFNLIDNSVGINVEKDAGVTDSQFTNLHLWVASYGGQNFNQTGLKVSGSLYQTIMDGVVFESFAKGDLSSAALYAVDIDTDFQTPILQEGITFLGSWTNMIHNPLNSDVQGEGAGVAFKQENIGIPVNTPDYSDSPTVFKVAPSTISSFKASITVDGSFSQNENVTVRFRLGFFDKDTAAGSGVVEKTFSASGSLWLSEDDLLTLYPYRDIVQSVLIDSKVDSSSSDATVQVSIFGTSVWSVILS
ncbi:MAG: hypothetical protein NWF01_05515 [Candidatus Bathyarchaeota archaeon]|nr:hypothetical protein [Candidatus Bathyarchaeota archaeon]